MTLVETPRGFIRFNLLHVTAAREKCCSLEHFLPKISENIRCRFTMSPEPTLDPENLFNSANVSKCVCQSRHLCNSFGPVLVGSVRVLKNSNLVGFLRSTGTARFGLNFVQNVCACTGVRVRPASRPSIKRLFDSSQLTEQQDSQQLVRTARPLLLISRPPRARVYVCPCLCAPVPPVCPIEVPLRTPPERFKNWIPGARRYACPGLDSPWSSPTCTRSRPGPS